MKHEEFPTEIAAALSDPIRVQMLEIIARGHDETCASEPHPQFPQAVCPYVDIQAKLGIPSRSKLSYHLKELRNAGLIEEHRLGKLVFYVLGKQTLQDFQKAINQHFFEAKANI